jgi:hypothetical protein
VLRSRRILPFISRIGSLNIEGLGKLPQKVAW